MDIKFMGYCPDSDLINTYTIERKDPMTLNDFIDKVNQDAVGGCSCCKQKVSKLYAVYSLDNALMLPLCLDCIRSLPIELEIINLYSNGAPPALRVIGG